MSAVTIYSDVVCMGVFAYFQIQFADRGVQVISNCLKPIMMSVELLLADGVDVVLFRC